MSPEETVHLALRRDVPHQARRLLPQAAALLGGDRTELLEDLQGAGRVGLVLGLRDWQPDRGLSLRSYLSLRVRAAIIDWLREMDPVGRYRRERAWSEGRETPESWLPPADVPAGYDPPDPREGPEETALRRTADAELRARLPRALALLSEQQRRVVRASYLAPAPLGSRAIGQTMGVGPGRVQQLRRQALARLRELLTEAEAHYG